MQEGSGLGSGASLRRTDEGVRPYVIFGGLIRWSPPGFWSCDFRVLLGGWGLRMLFAL